MKKGFTLIELLVVVALIGVLTTLVMANLASGRERSRDAQRKSDLRSMSTALRLYYNDKGVYPATGYFDSLWGLEWAESGTVYMSKTADDPIPGRDYKYQVGSDSDPTDTDSFILSACLENPSDDKGVTTLDTTWCPEGWMYQARP